MAQMNAFSALSGQARLCWLAHLALGQSRNSKHAQLGLLGAHLKADDARLRCLSYKISFRSPGTEIPCKQPFRIWSSLKLNPHYRRRSGGPACCYRR
jgi:hypothetical protein